MNANQTSKRVIWRVVLSSISLFCAGCGSFPLGTAYPLQGQSRDQTQMNVLICQDQAKNEANSNARVAGSFIAGLTIVGAPIAIAEERRKQREVWADCMTAKGYRVVPPDDAPKQATASPPQATPARTALPPSSQEPSPSARDDAAQLTKLKDLHDRRLITDAEYEAKREQILDRL